MKAIVRTRYGSTDMLELKEIEKPAPKDDQVLVKVQAVSINVADLHLLQGDPFMLRFIVYGFPKPKNTILGADIAGQVAAVGRHVKQFQPGDAVFGDVSQGGWGGLAEYVAVPEKAIVPKPANCSFEEAAAAPVAGITALQGLRCAGEIQPGQKVLINGASGGVGTFAVQIAKAFGAEVTAVCSTRNIEQARAIGADHVIDYTREDFTRSGRQYDVILAVNGYHTLTEYKRALSSTGVYVCAGGAMPQVFQAMLGPLFSRRDGKQLRSMGVAQANPQDLIFLKDLIEAGKMKAVIDRRYPLNETVEAFRYLAQGHARGKVVITL